MSFTEFRAAYPARVGAQRWGDAERFYAARIREGHTHAEIMAGVRRYAEFLRAIGKERTEYVQQAASFVGRNKGFLEDWTPPNSSGRVNTMKLPTIEDLRRAEAERLAQERVAEAEYEARRLGLEPRRVNESAEEFYRRGKQAVTARVVGG